MNRSRRCQYVMVALTITLVADVQAQLLLNDSLNGSTSGTRSGGTFVAGGWRVDNQYDSIFWHVPTVSHGAFEYNVKGLPANSCPGNTSASTVTR